MMSYKVFGYIPTGIGIEVPEFDVLNYEDKSYLFQLEGEDPSELRLKRIYEVGRVVGKNMIIGERVEDPELFERLERVVLFGDEEVHDLNISNELLEEFLNRLS
jgi:hypothetical protein